MERIVSEGGHIMIILSCCPAVIIEFVWEVEYFPSEFEEVKGE